MLQQLTFDTTVSDDDRHNVGAYLRVADGELITGGDGSSDDVATSFEGLDARAFGYAFDGSAWDRLRATSGALHVDIQDASIDVNLDHASDSVRLGDGTTLHTGTTVGSDHGLDVYNLNDPRVADTDFATTATSVTSTSGDLIGTALTSRKRLLIANEGNRKMYIGKTTATTSDFPIPPGAVLDLSIGPSIDLQAVTSTGTADARMLELS